MFPNNVSGQFVPAQQPIDRIVTEAFAVICKMRHGEVGLSGDKKLTIIDSIDAHMIN
jgi:hypothetical protein